MSRSNRNKTQRGAILVEFATVLPLLLLLLMGITEFGLLFYNKQVLTNASREGARAGIVEGTGYVVDNDIEKIVQQYCEKRLITFGSHQKPTLIKPTRSPADAIYRKITVSYDYTFLVPKLLNLGPVLKLNASTEMRMESDSS